MNLRTAISAIRLRCPCCHKGRLFASFMKMNSACPSCRLRFESEPGFYQISMFINLVLTLVSATLVTAGLFYADILTLEGLWLFPILMAIFPLVFLRVSRSFWLAVMYRFAPEEFVAAKESSPAAAAITH